MTLIRNTRKAIKTECPTCGQLVLAGLDADLIAGHAVIDPTPITPAQEVAEWAAGRRTYTYDHHHREIDYRDRDRIRPNPATNGDVHRTHTCPKEVK